MAKAILTGEKVEEFSFNQRFTFLAPFITKRPWLPKYFLMGNCPRHAGNWYC